MEALLIKKKRKKENDNRAVIFKKTLQNFWSHDNVLQAKMIISVQVLIWLRFQKSKVIQRIVNLFLSEHTEALGQQIIHTLQHEKPQHWRS